jgi:hypothetical protein
MPAKAHCRKVSVHPILMEEQAAVKPRPDTWKNGSRASVVPRFANDANAPNQNGPGRSLAGAGESTAADARRGASHLPVDAPRAGLVCGPASRRLLRFGAETVSLDRSARREQRLAEKAGRMQEAFPEPSSESGGVPEPLARSDSLAVRPGGRLSVLPAVPLH